MAVKFRNIDADPSAPVETWGFEGLLAAVDRGSLAEWRRIIAAVRADPYGEVAETLADVLDLAQDPGVVAAMRLAVEQVGRSVEKGARYDAEVTLSRLRRQAKSDGENASADVNKSTEMRAATRTIRSTQEGLRFLDRS